MKVIDGGFSYESKPTPKHDSDIPYFENRIWIEKDTDMIYKFDLKTHRWESLK